MADINKCVIVGCELDKNEDRKFFPFPLPHTRLYETWVHICYRSAEAIRNHPKHPYICDKHFHLKDIKYSMLSNHSVPALYLNPSSDLFAEQIDLAAAQERKIRMATLINDVVYEWAIRAKNMYFDVDSLTLKAIATKVRNMIDPALTLTFDDIWFKKFRLQYLQNFQTKQKWNKDLNLVNIIKSLDSNVSILPTDNIDDFDEIWKLSFSDTELKPREMNVISVPKYCVKQYISKVKKVLPKNHMNKDSDSIDSNVENRPQKYTEQPGNRAKNSRSAREDDGNITLIDLSNDGDKIVQIEHQGEKFEIFTTHESYFAEESHEGNIDNSSQSKKDLNKTINKIDDDESISIDNDSPAGSDALEYFGCDEKPELAITSYKQAIQHLGTLKEFIVKQDDSRAIRLFSVLEKLLKERANSE